MAFLKGKMIRAQSPSAPQPRIRIVCANPATTFTRFVQPRYPKQAVAKELQGKVILELAIDKQGIPTRIDVMKGDPLLAEAAIEAARQWRYRALLLNHQAVEMSTKAEINFVLPSSKTGTHRQK